MTLLQLTFSAMVVRLQRIFLARHASHATFCFLDGPFSALDSIVPAVVDGPVSLPPRKATPGSCPMPVAEAEELEAEMPGCNVEELEDGWRGMSDAADTGWSGAECSSSSVAPAVRAEWPCAMLLYAAGMALRVKSSRGEGGCLFRLGSMLEVKGRNGLQVAEMEGDLSLPSRYLVLVSLSLSSFVDASRH